MTLETLSTTYVEPHRVGLFSIGLEAYWPQFSGLRERLEGYNRQITANLEGLGAKVVNLGMIDDVDKAVVAGHAFRRNDVDLNDFDVGPEGRGLKSQVGIDIQHPAVIVAHHSHTVMFHLVRDLRGDKPFLDFIPCRIDDVEHPGNLMKRYGAAPEDI